MGSDQIIPTHLQKYSIRVRQEEGGQIKSSVLVHWWQRAISPTRLPREKGSQDFAKPIYNSQIQDSSLRDFLNRRFEFTKIFKVDLSSWNFAKSAKAWIGVIWCYARINKTQDSEFKGFSSGVKQERMSCTSNPNAGHGGCSGNGRRAGHGQGGCGRGANATILSKASEVGGCKDLEDHIFTIGSGNKGKDDDMLRTSMEKIGTYIGTKFGDEAAQEWISGKKIIPSEPAYSQAVLLRQAARVKATKDRIELKLKGLRTEKLAIQAEIMLAPTDWRLLKEMREVDDDIAKGEIELAY